MKLALIAFTLLATVQATASVSASDAPKRRPSTLFRTIEVLVGDATRAGYDVLCSSDDGTLAYNATYSARGIAVHSNHAELNLVTDRSIKAVIITPASNDEVNYEGKSRVAIVTLKALKPTAGTREGAVHTMNCLVTAKRSEVGAQED